MKLFQQKNGDLTLDNQSIFLQAHILATLSCSKIAYQKHSPTTAINAFSAILPSIPLLIITNNDKLIENIGNEGVNVQHNTNVDPEEIAKFEKMASTWWDPQGEFKPLHKLNPLRLNYIDQTAGGIFGKRVLDVGCGGGILSESMAKLGAKVDGLDMGEEPLEVARLHALAANVNINYIKSTAEAHRENNQGMYDVVTCMEMLEHVPDPSSVIQACSDMVKPGGYVFFSTINRNIMAYLQTIIGAEYVLKMLPIGTHDHKKFIKPSELIALAEHAQLQCTDATGITYNPITSIFKYTQKLDVNYMIATVKND